MGCHLGCQQRTNLRLVAVDPSASSRWESPIYPQAPEVQTPNRCAPTTRGEESRAGPFWNSETFFREPLPKGMPVGQTAPLYSKFTSWGDSGLSLSMWMDGIHFAPPKKPWNDEPVNTNKEWFQTWFQSGAKWILSIHSITKVTYVGVSSFSSPSLATSPSSASCGALRCKLLYLLKSLGKNICPIVIDSSPKTNRTKYRKYS